MKRPEIRHYTEEELLIHVFGDESVEAGAAVSRHLESCRECAAVYQDYVELVRSVKTWSVPELPEASWRAQRSNLLAQFREDQLWMRRKGLLHGIRRGFEKIWVYALENPLPTIGYVAAAIAFASERTITTFRLDRVLPATTEVFKIIRQVL